MFIRTQPCADVPDFPRFFIAHGHHPVRSLQDGIHICHLLFINGFCLFSVYTESKGGFSHFHPHFSGVQNHPSILTGDPGCYLSGHLLLTDAASEGSGKGFPVKTDPKDLLLYRIQINPEGTSLPVQNLQSQSLVPALCNRDFFREPGIVVVICFHENLRHFEFFSMYFRISFASSGSSTSQ